MKKRKIKWIVLTIVLTYGMAGCTYHPPHHERLELISIGIRENLIHGNLSAQGAGVYTCYEEGADSMVLKTGIMNRRFSGYEDDIEIFNAAYVWFRLSPKFRDDIRYIIDYVKTKKQGKLNVTTYDQAQIGWGLGTWLLIFTDKEGIKHYYHFTFENDLPEPLRDVCDNLARTGRYDHNNLTPADTCIETDSLVGKLLQLPVLRNALAEIPGNDLKYIGPFSPDKSQQE